MPVAPGTGDQSSWPAGLEYRENVVQSAAKSAPALAHWAHTAKTMWLTVSRPITRIPWVGTTAQCRPPSWVAYNCGPNAQALTPSSDRIWLTPVPPSGAPVTGAGTPCQVVPPSLVAATEVQSYALGGPQCPGVPAWPITHPVLVDTKVTEEAAKLAGTGGGAVGVGVADWASGPEVPVEAGWPGPVEGWAGVAVPDIATGVLPTGPDRISRGTVIAPASTTTAPAAVSAARPAFRRRARLLICSKVPGCGCKGVTRSSSQVSMSSRGSSMGFPQNRAEPGPRVVQVGLDRAFRPPEHLRHVPDREPGVVMQQERLAQPFGQALDERTHVHVLGRVMNTLGRDGGAHRAQGAPLPADLAPVVSDQVRRDHVEVAL